MNRNVLMLIMTLLTLSLLLLGCNSSSDSSTSTTDPAPTASNEETTIEFWYIQTGEQEKVLLEAIERFEEAHPNVTVNARYIANDDYKQRMLVAMSGGNPPDIFVSWGGGWLKEFVDSGQVLDITDHIDKNHFKELALNNSTYEDRVYGVPLAVTLHLFFYNTEIFNEYELQPPETYEELIQIIDVLNNKNIYPIALTNQTAWPGAFYLMDFADRLGGHELFQEAFNRTGRGFDDQAYVKAGEYIQDLVNRNAFNPGFNGIPYDAGQGRQLMYSGQAAMMLMTTAFLNNVRNESPEFENIMDVFPTPILPDGEGDPTNLSGAVSPVFSVYQHTEHPELAIELVRELTSLETAQSYANRTGTLSAVENVVIEDEFVKKFEYYLHRANHLQMPYDQTLPPALAELHKDTTQELFGLTMTPEEAARKMEEKAREVLE
ncbi:raffinose/stachyose/melibiose transport system substrate-binding protein [Caldalkalibacillus uzonensis]|uniref:Raffinose/stachyose/melibiose transport system substrate-binding protein n=1 Tax=Caldalkalibacillus uzonensis TaxID=353224 RepID=A0ABU0CQX4_9BACI|nr:extracellular solute-binding protein [Caldalkalibacillus uzonensis]MDQ0338814.1 raffinose/stachyose/melibiose transport system substrate-binding protein [Caldalkalibacillus uzonensis]